MNHRNPTSNTSISYTKPWTPCSQNWLRLAEFHIDTVILVILGALQCKEVLKIYIAFGLYRTLISLFHILPIDRIDQPTMAASPADTIMQKEAIHEENWELEPQNTKAVKSPRKSGIINVAISGLALFSDGYNAQISTSRAQFHLTRQAS